MKINSKFIRPQVVRCILLVSALVVSRHAPAQTLTITNTTSGGSTSFQIGDGVYLAITGASAGFPVTYTDNVDYTGENFVPYAAGNVPPNGVYEFTGTAQSSNVGHHEQKWFVGGVQVGQRWFFWCTGVVRLFSGRIRPDLVGIRLPGGTRDHCRWATSLLVSIPGMPRHRWCLLNTGSRLTS